MDVLGNYATLDLTLNLSGPLPARKAGGPPRSTDLVERFAEFFREDERWPVGGRPHPFALSIDLEHDRFVVGGISETGNTHDYWCGVWSGSARQPRQVLHHRYYLTACGISRDCRWVASSDALGQVSVWNAETGERRYCFAAKSQPVYSVAFDRTGQRLLFGREPSDDWGYNHYGMLTHELDLADRTIRRIPRAKPPQAMLQSGGRRLQSEELPDGTPQISVWRGPRQESRLPFGNSSRHIPLCYQFLRGNMSGMSDGIIVGGENGSLVCFEPTRFLSRRNFVGHADRIWCVDESFDGRYLASGSGDGTIRIWILGGFRDWGNLAAYADGDGRIYHVVPGTPTHEAGIRPGNYVHSIGGRLLGSLGEDLVSTGKWPFRAGQTVDVRIEHRGLDSINERLRLPPLPAGRTKQVELSNMGDVGEPLLSLFVSEDCREWVVWTPQGYYDASPQGSLLVGWHVNRGCFKSADFYPVEQFRKRFHRPDVIAEVLRLGNVEEAVKVANARRPRSAPYSDLPNEMSNYRPPEISILEPTDGTRVGSSKLLVKAEIKSRSEEPLRDARLLVNGKAFGIKGVVVEADRPAVDRLSDRHWRITRPVSLAAGENTIAVVAATDTVESKSEAVTVTYRRSVAPTDKPRLLVAAIGVSQYEQNEYSLQFADRDALDFASVWHSQEGGLYREVLERVLTNADANRANVMDLMEWLVETAGPQDVTILFLSGHGLCDRNQNYYFAPHDMHPDRLRSTAVSWAEIRRTILDLRSKRFLLFADTCHAGGAVGASHAFGEISKDAGAIVFGSCTPQAESLENSDWGHGAFTKSLLEIFASAESDLDNPPDGRLSIDDLAHNLDSRVRKLTDERQVPVVGRPSTITDYDVFQLPE